MRSGSRSKRVGRHEPQPPRREVRRCRQAGSTSRSAPFERTRDRVDGQVAPDAGRSRSSSPSSGSRSTCQLRSRATTRHAPNASESGNENPPVARLSARAARSSCAPSAAGDDDVVIGRRRATEQRSREAPLRPASRRSTIAASASSGSPSCQRHPVAVVAARHPARDPAQDLVSDRVDPVGEILDV